MALPAKYKFTVQGAEAKPKAPAKKKSAKKEAPAEADWCLKDLAPTAQKWVVPLKRRKRKEARKNEKRFSGCLVLRRG